MRGILVTIEGIDGSGKTTALRIISHRLIETLGDRQLVFTAEPTSSQAGELLRRVHLSGRQVSETHEICKVKRMEEMLLFMADHANHLAETILPSLCRGDIVISDRYADSTAAYQGVTLKNIVPDPVAWIKDLYRPWNIVPDRTLLFTVDPALAVKRIRSRTGADSSVEKFEREAFLRDVDLIFRLMAKSEPERFTLIDASRQIEEVADDALKAIIDLVFKKKHSGLEH